MIDVTVSNGRYFIWNAEGRFHYIALYYTCVSNISLNYPLSALDVYKLRTEYRIIGSYTGCLASLPRQDQMLGLPMELMSEEVAFLITQEVVNVVQHEDLNSPAPRFAQEDWEKLSDASFSEQATLFKEERVAHVMKLADRIIAGKKRAKRDNDGVIDEKAALQKEIDKIPDMSKDTMMIQICTSKILFKQFVNSTLEPICINFVFYRASLGIECKII